MFIVYVYSISLLHCMYGLRCDNLLLNEYMMMMMMMLAQQAIMQSVSRT